MPIHAHTCTCVYTQFDLDYCQAFYHDPLTRLIAQALPVFDIKFAFTFLRKCLFVMHSYKFLYMMHCWSNKTYYFYENEKGLEAKFAYC